MAFSRNLLSGASSKNRGRNGEAAAADNEIWEWIRAVGGALLIAWLIQQFLFQVFMVDGHSMNPTLADRERTIVNKVIYRIRPPRYGEIIVFQAPPDPTQDYIKRVIGLPGDVIEVHNHTVFRNGQALAEPYVNAPTYGDYGPVRVPPGTVFGMGDNRNQSDDSRAFGPIPMTSIVGRADVIIYPLPEIELFPYEHNKPPRGIGAEVTNVIRY